MSLYRVIPSDGTRVHLARAMREDLAKILPADSVTPDNWYYWRTVCGKDMIGHRTTLMDADCPRCRQALDRAMVTVENIRARFGDGEVL